MNIKKEYNNKKIYWSTVEYRLFASAHYRNKIDRTIDICNLICDMYIDAVNENIKNNLVYKIDTRDFMNKCITPKINNEEGIFENVNYFKIRKHVLRRALQHAEIYVANTVSKFKGLDNITISHMEPSSLYVEDKEDFSIKNEVNRDHPPKGGIIKLGKDKIKARNTINIPFEYKNIKRVSVERRDKKYYVKVLYFKEKETLPIFQDEIMTIDIHNNDGIYCVRHTANDRYDITPYILEKEFAYKKILYRRAKLIEHYNHKYTFNDGNITNTMINLSKKIDKIDESLYHKRYAYLSYAIDVIFSRGYPKIIKISKPDVYTRKNLTTIDEKIKPDVCAQFYDMLIYKLSKVKDIKVFTAYIDYRTCPVCKNQLKFATIHDIESCMCVNDKCKLGKSWFNKRISGNIILYNINYTK